MNDFDELLEKNTKDSVVECCYMLEEFVAQWFGLFDIREGPGKSYVSRAESPGRETESTNLHF